LRVQVKLNVSFTNVDLLFRQTQQLNTVVLDNKSILTNKTD